MHPFALNDPKLDHISGGLLPGMTPPENPLTPIAPINLKDEEVWSTDALGEEGGWLPPPYDEV